MASRAILSNFFDGQKTQNHPRYLSALSRALFPTLTFLEIAVCRLRVVPHFSSGIVERAKRERAWNLPRAWGDFHARSRLARSTISKEKWGTTRGLSCVRLPVPYQIRINDS